MPEPQAAPGLQLMELLTGGWIAQALCVAAKLNVADALSAGPRTCDDLSRELSCDARSLYRLLRALSSIQVFHEQNDGCFALTPLAEQLRTDDPRSMRATAMMLGDEHYQAWGALSRGVQSGRAPFDLTFGQPVFHFYEANPGAAAIFHRAMTEITRGTHTAAIDAYDFRQFAHIVDVGGGRGTLLAAILQACPKSRGTIFDQPSVAAAAAQYLSELGVADRCEFVGGDFFNHAPAEADAYILSSIIHDWEDGAAKRILQNIRKAIPPQGKLLLVEQVVRGHNEPDFTKFCDLNMLVMTGGCERTEEEYRRLLRDAGFEMIGLYPTQSSSWIIEGTPQ